MRTAGRLLAAAAVVLTGVVAQVQPAAAAESISSGPWAGSALSGGPSSSSTGEYSLVGTFRRSGVDRQVAVSVWASPSGSGACRVDGVTLPAASTPRAFNVTLRIPCNGTYTLTARAVTTENNSFFPEESATMDRTIQVAGPAPTVTGVRATADGRKVTVAWDDMRFQAPDLQSYIVERRIGDEDFERIDTVGPSALFITDTDLPAAGGEATYRVLAKRPVPGGTVTSNSGSEDTVTFAPAPTTTTTGGSGGGDGGSGGTDGSGGGGTGSGNGSSSGGGTTGAAGSGATPGRPASGRDRVTAPRVFAGTFLPPLLRPAAETIQTTPTTGDPGYDEELPFGDRELGAEDPVLPNDAMASILTDGDTGQGLVVPMGTALVLAMWAVHLRLLARAAARAPE